MITKETIVLKFTYEMSINTETGEIIEQKLIDKTIDKSKKTTKKVEEENSEPELILQNATYKLNNAAVTLMNLTPGDKLLIRYSYSNPVIGTREAFGSKGGNALSKKYTVICRGVANEQLKLRGTKFKIISRADNAMLFDLISQDKPVDEEPPFMIDDAEIENILNTPDTEDVLEDSDFTFEFKF